MTDYNPNDDPHLDLEMKPLITRMNHEFGIETFESCIGGDGHAFPEPTVRFHGQREEGMRAVSILMTHGIIPSDLRRVWSVINGELVGPEWEMTFRREEVVTVPVGGMP